MVELKYKFLFSDLVLCHITKFEPQYIKTVTRSSKSISEGLGNLKYKCLITPKVICFQKSYFVRTVKNWNVLPFDLGSTESLESFKILLKEHLWLILGLKPD